MTGPGRRGFQEGTGGGTLPDHPALPPPASIFPIYHLLPSTPFGTAVSLPLPPCYYTQRHSCSLHWFPTTYLLLPFPCTARCLPTIYHTATYHPFTPPLEEKGGGGTWPSHRTDRWRRKGDPSLLRCDIPQNCSCIYLACETFYCPSPYLHDLFKILSHPFCLPLSLFVQRKTVAGPIGLGLPLFLLFWTQTHSALPAPV